MTTTSSYFYPYVRQGLAASIQHSATDSPTVKQRASVEVFLTAVARRKDSNVNDSVNISQTISLLGPGDVLGFHPRVVARTDPQPYVGDFEPNYFPLIEFSPADFLWRFTPQQEQANIQTGGMTPWITLIVLDAEPIENGGQPEFDVVQPGKPQLPKHLLVDPSALPPLEHAWRWAHVQITGVSGLSDDADPNSETRLQAILKHEPERAVCRLLCTRRLAPRTRYAAFVVPTFKLGILAGLGCPLDSTIEGLRLAWGEKAGSEGNDCIQGHDGKMRLPFYFSWEFRTSERGDFEHLVRLLEPRELQGLGLRDLDCVRPGFHTPRIDRELTTDEPQEEERKHYLGMEGALQSLDMTPTIWGQDPVSSPPDANSPTPFQKSLAALINKPDVDAQSLQLFHMAETAEIKDIKLCALGSGTAVGVVWKTTLAVDSVVEYATEGEFIASSNYDQSIRDEKLDTVHELILEELTPGITYHFRIKGNGSDATVQTEDGTFTVPPLPSVVPPIYGRWHYGKLKRKHNTLTVIDADNQKEWIDVLNLDPRHRAAAGLGAEVVRKQQEALVAAAWEQLGEVERTNDLLRRAQFGREISSVLHHRMGRLSFEERLRLTGPVHPRAIVDDPNPTVARSLTVASKKMSVAHVLSTQSALSRPAFDPSLRRIVRPNGPVRKRQNVHRTLDLLTRLASRGLEPAGADPPIPHGVIRIHDVTKILRQDLPAPPPKPTIALDVKPSTIMVQRGGGGVDDQPVTSQRHTLTVKWSTTNAVTCTASGMWNGEKSSHGQESISLMISSDSRALPFTLECIGPPGTDGQKGRKETQTFTVNVFVFEIPDVEAGGGVIARSRAGLSQSSRETRANSEEGGGIEISQEDRRAVDVHSVAHQTSSAKNDPGLLFHDKFLAPAQITQALAKHDPFQSIEGIPNPQKTAQAINATLTNWLNEPAVPKDIPPTQDPEFLLSMADQVSKQLDPAETFVERTKSRMRLNGDLMERFDAGKSGDLLRPLLAGPQFPQPMYEPLRDLSHDLLLPGVERVPQNTIGLLKTNRRFIEAYMAGLNHEFAAELRWRGYPTDQRGTAFRQFWDVSEYVATQADREKLVARWLEGKTVTDDSDLDVRERITNLPLSEKQRIVRRYLAKALKELEEKWFAEPSVKNTNDLQNKRRILQQLRSGRLSVIKKIENNDLVDVILRLLECQEVTESLKDILPMTHWSKPLGENINHNRQSEPLVLVIRGDLLTRYPNAVIYAIDGVLQDDGTCVPGLSEHVSSQQQVKPRIFPIFRATLPPDLTFLGFPFEKETTKKTDTQAGKFFVLEERMGEARFGLDTPSGSKLKTWNDLSWTHFGLGDPESYGTYLDSASLSEALSPENNMGREWDHPNKTSSATRAWITCQKPVRISIHADQMIPKTN